MTRRAPCESAPRQRRRRTATSVMSSTIVAGPTCAMSRSQRSARSSGTSDAACANRANPASSVSSGVRRARLEDVGADVGLGEPEQRSAVELHELFLPLGQFAQGRDQVPILQPQLVQRAVRDGAVPAARGSARVDRSLHRKSCFSPSACKRRRTDIGYSSFFAVQ
jgi:hypothetical protein